MSFYAAPPFNPYTSNRGMTDSANQYYANLVNYYTPRPVGVGPTWKSQAGQQQPSGGMDWGSLFGGMFGASGATPSPGIDPRHLAGRAQLEYQRQAAQGNSRFRNRFGGGTRYNQGDYGSAAPPPATTNPQTPVGGAGGGQVAQVDSGIKSGQLLDASIQAGLQRLLAGENRALSVPASLSGAAIGNNVTGGAFGDMMRANTMRGANEYSRAAAQQQADMQHAFEVARANGSLQQSQLTSDLNRENVMNGVIQRNAMLDLLGQLMRGFGGV